jgi:hypothetical protein
VDEENGIRISEKPVLNCAIDQNRPGNASLAARQSERNALLSGPLLIIVAAATAVVAPLLLLSNPSGHDFQFHLNTWMEVLGQWKQGIPYPRWAALANWGYGDARFIFYPPVSWVAGAALGAILPWKAVTGAYVWLALTLSGCSMFLLGGEWLNYRDAVFAAAVYAANPYYIMTIYWRSAFAELLAGAMLPLLLLYTLRAERDGSKVIVPLALIVAGAWLTNVPAAVMVTYSLGLLFAILAVQQRSLRLLWYGASAVLLGGALAAFYILPAVCEQRWVDIAQVLSPGVRPLDNFLFTRTGAADHDRFNRLISLVALEEIIVFSASTFLSQEWKSPSGDQRANSRFRNALEVWSGAAALLMLSLTSRAWETLPELRFVQFPWRWLSCLNAALALLLAATWKRWRWRLLFCLAPFLVVAVAWPHIPRPSWQGTADIARMLEHQRSGQGYEGVDEYVPAEGDAYEIKQDAPLVALEDDGPAPVTVERWRAESRVLRVHTNQPGTLVLRLFYYPAWRVEVNGQLIEAQTDDTTGQMLIPVQAGESQIHITLARTWDRTAGGIVSLGALLVLLLAALRRPLSHRAQLSSSELSS